MSALAALWPWAAGPFLITLWMILGAGGITLLFTDDLLALLWSRPGQQSGFWYTAGWTAVVWIVRVLLFLVSAVVLWVVGNMLASPFWDFLAEGVEKRELDRPDADFDWRVALGDAWMSIRHSALGLLLYALLMAPLLLLNLIPGVGTVLYTVLSWTATVFFVSREMMDIPLSRRRTPFRDKIRWLAEHKAVVAGLGTASTLMLAVPLVNLFVMPLTVMGGTLLYCRLDAAGQGVPQRGPGARSAPRA